MYKSGHAGGRDRRRELSELTADAPRHAAHRIGLLARKHVEVGLTSKDGPPSERLEASGSFSALFTYRVRVSAVADVDEQLVGWSKKA